MLYGRRLLYTAQPHRTHVWTVELDLGTYLGQLHKSRPVGPFTVTGEVAGAHLLNNLAPLSAEATLTREVKTYGVRSKVSPRADAAAHARP